MFSERLHADCSLPELIQILAVSESLFMKKKRLFLWVLARRSARSGEILIIERDLKIVTHSHQLQCTWIYNEIWKGGSGRCPQGWTAVHSGALKAVHRVMPGGWEGGSLTALWEAVKQMHTIRRVVAIDTMLRIVGYLSVRKYSCFYLFIHTYVFCFPLHLSFDRTQRNTPSSQFVTMKTSLMGWFFLSVFNRNFLLFFFFFFTSCAVNKEILIC